MTVKYKGELLTVEELKEVAENFTLTYHSAERILSRNPKLNIYKTILNPLIAYFNTDGTINIALNEFEYLVVATNRKPYKIITYKEKSDNDVDVFVKREMAMRGKGRKSIYTNYTNKQHKTCATFRRK